MTSIKIKTSWVNNNITSDGVKIYKHTESFDVTTLPVVYKEVTSSSNFYEDLDVVEGQIYFYMLSCFLGEQEVFTECFEVKSSSDPVNLSFISAATTPARDVTAAAPWPLIIPKYNKGDIIVVAKFGSDTELAGYGFMPVDVSGLTGNYFKLWYKIAQVTRDISEAIDITTIGIKFCIVLRPDSPVTEVSFSLSNEDMSIVGNGDSSSLKYFKTPLASYLNKKGYFLQILQSAAAYAGYGKAQTITVDAPATLLMSPKIPVDYSYASTYSVPANTDIKAFGGAAFGQTSNGSQSVFGGYSAGINYFSNEGGVLRFLNILVVGR